MSEIKPLKQANESKVYALYYAFFLIPLLVIIFGVMFFFTFKVLTYETNSPIDYLSDIQYGAATKRWQSAYELSKILSNQIPLSPKNISLYYIHYLDELISLVTLLILPILIN